MPNLALRKATLLRGPGAVVANVVGTLANTVEGAGFTLAP